MFLHKLFDFGLPGALSRLVRQDDGVDAPLRSRLHRLEKSATTKSRIVRQIGSWRKRQPSARPHFGQQLFKNSCGAGLPSRLASAQESREVLSCCTLQFERLPFAVGDVFNGGDRSANVLACKSGPMRAVCCIQG